MIGKFHKVFQVRVGGKMLDVYDRPGIEHIGGKMNATPTTWWLWYNAKLPPEDWKAEHDSWVPWVDHVVARPAWDIAVTTGNSIKCKWGDWRISKYAKLTIACDGRPVFAETVRDVEYALARAQVLVVQLMEHSFNFREPDKEIGRAIWYYGQAATIDELRLEDGEVYLRSVSTDGFNLLKSNDYPEGHADHLEDEWHGQRRVCTGIFDRHIDWHRAVGQIGKDAGEGVPK